MVGVDMAVQQGAVGRQMLASLLRDPRAYFAEARRWARASARADLERELADAQRRRSRQSVVGHVLRVFGFAR